MTAPQPGLVARLGPTGIAAVASGVLIIFGLGAVIIPALTDGGPGSAKAPAVTATQQAAAADDASPDPGAPTSAAPAASSTSSTAAATSKAPTLVAANFNSGFEDRVVQLVNGERRKARCEGVRMNGQLRTAARAHSADMAARDFTNSKGSDGSSPEERAQAAGYDGFQDELIAKGGDAGDVVKHWLRDGNDRDVLLDCSVKSIGVGAAIRGRTAYWTVDTGRA